MLEVVEARRDSKTALRGEAVVYFDCSGPIVGNPEVTAQKPAWRLKV